MAKRVGLFGGTFDPVHNAHVALAHAALQALALDEVRWVPSGHSWQKDRAATPAEHREAMVRLAMGGEPRFVLDRSELERPGPSYTLDTVRALHAAEPGREWVLIIGQDQYAGLHTWRDWPKLLALVTLAVANRPGTRAAPSAEVLAWPHRVVPLPMLDISATDIRERVARGADISHLVPPQVARYIESHRLYRGLADGEPQPQGS
ncbi:MAG: nicotinate (nicotinamide) nucleotide adenylyltransferase [Leptothrix sp. (in: Bacteria)]|nr:nicotinate (nicotinamide) nucleotide adenylyltransferase [Leptothrix sp. (in: b-proteobacteria)]